MKGKGVSANMDYILSEVNRIGAKRLVIDSITAFLVACKEEFEYRALMHLFYKILKRSRCTTIMTCSIPLGSNKLGIGIEELHSESE